LSFALDYLKSLRSYQEACDSPEKLAELEQEFAMDAKLSYNYAIILGGRFDIGEPVIAKSANFSLLYAHYILKGRFELGEIIIATDGYCSVEYALGVLRDRFELGEPAIWMLPENSSYRRNYDRLFFKMTSIDWQKEGF